MTQNDPYLQLSQKSFKTCFTKLAIIATFIHRNNILFYLFLKFKLPKKGVKGDAVYTVNAHKVVFG